MTTVGLLVFAGVAGAETIHRRGGGEPISAVSIELHPEGVRAIRASGASQLISWDMVRAIEDIDDVSTRNAWTRMQPMSEDLWRARTRLQRGDGRLAGPLFETYFDSIRTNGADTEMALIVAEGLLRSRLASGALETALPSALETIRLRRAGVQTDRYLGLPEVVDERLWVVPTLPPIASDPSALMALPQTLAPWMQGEDAHVAALASAYASMSGRAHLGADATSEGAAVVRTSLDTLSRDAEVRAQARAHLEVLADQDEAPVFIDAWRRWFVAQSNLLEDDVDLDLALIQLLHLPAIHKHSDPALASRAVASAADILEAAGRISEAGLLRRELHVSQADVRPALLPEKSAPTNNQLEPESDEDPEGKVK
jgi:hypothetical protein